MKCGLVSYGAEDEEETELKEPEQDILQELDEYAFEEPEGDEFPERENENGDYQGWHRVSSYLTTLDVFSRRFS